MTITVKGPIPEGWQVVAVPDGWTDMFDLMMFHACKTADAKDVARMCEYRALLVAAPRIHETHE